MEEIVTVNGKQYKLSSDRPLTALERQQTIDQIKAQTGCSSCHQPRTLSNMSNNWGYGGIRSLAECGGSPKAESDTVTLTATPADGTGPYHVRFWRKPNAAGAMTYGELGVARTVSEGSTTSTSFTIFDTDFVAAVGDGTADTPTTDTTGAITDPATSGAALATGSIRVATTIYDSCPTTPGTCVDWCDVVLSCVPPTCNFVVS